MTRRGGVIFDRDGVLNDDLAYTWRPEDLRLVAGAAAAVRQVNARGFAAIVATNQSGVARGFFREADVWAFHAALADALAAGGAVIDGFYYCPFHPDAADPAYRAADHPDRKPNPGMLLRAIADFGLDREEVVMIGDQETDLEAARRAGVRGVQYRGGGLDATVAAALAGV
jgi:D-glycero-D-manno-heptose 1,7-bisphosphate phosphatase